MQQFGANVRLIRKARQMSIKQLSELSGVSQTMISEVERGLKIPTIDVAGKIAAALGIDLTNLMGGAKKSKAILVREKERPLLATPNNSARIWLLSPSVYQHNLDFALVHLPVGEELKWPYPNQAGTGVYILVTRGHLQIRLGQEDVYKLEENDLLYFDGYMDRTVTNPGPDDCQYYIIIDYPPGQV